MPPGILDCEDPKSLSDWQQRLRRRTLQRSLRLRGELNELEAAVVDAAGDGGAAADAELQASALQVKPSCAANTSSSFPRDWRWVRPLWAL